MKRLINSTCRAMRYFIFQVLEPQSVKDSLPILQLCLLYQHPPLKKKKESVPPPKSAHCFQDSSVLCLKECRNIHLLTEKACWKKPY